MINKIYFVMLLCSCYQAFGLVTQFSFILNAEIADEKLYLSNDGRYFGFSSVDPSGGGNRVRLFKDSTEIFSKDLKEYDLWNIQFEEQKNRIFIYSATAKNSSHYNRFSFIVIDTLGKILFQNSPTTTDERVVLNKTKENTAITYPAIDYELETGKQKQNEKTFIRLYDAVKWQEISKMSVKRKVREVVFVDTIIYWVDDANNLNATDFMDSLKWQVKIPYKRPKENLGMVHFGPTVEMVNGNLNTLFTLNDTLLAVITSNDHKTLFYGRTGKVEKEFYANKNAVLPLPEGTKTYKFGYNGIFLFCVRDGEYIGTVDESTYLEDLSKGMKDFLGSNQVNINNAMNFKAAFSNDRRAILIYNVKKKQLALFRAQE